MKVLELGRFVSVAYAGMLLAEQGHAVTKWTQPGEPVWSLQYGAEMWAWLSAGKALFERPAADVARLDPGQVDLVVDNLRQSAWQRWGVDPSAEAQRLGIRWVSLRDEFDGLSFDAIAQARAWGDHIGYVPAYIGDTTAGLWMAFKATVSREPGHFILRQASCLAKLVEGEGVVTPRRDGKRVPWEQPDEPYGPDGDGVAVGYKGQTVREPFRDEEWRRENLYRDADGRYVI